MPQTIAQLLSQTDWHQERQRLHSILTDCDLAASVKWGKLCYSLDGANIAIIFGLKDSCAVGFFKGVLLDDPAGVLEAPGDHSQSMRRIHFTSLAQIEEKAGVIRDYAARAIAIEKQGLQIPAAESKMPERPAELRERFAAEPALEAAFDRLTPGRQRGYLIHFTDTAKAETRRKRIEKYAAHILSGKGMHDR